MLKIGIVAGEPSGDYLGAFLVRCLKQKYGECQITGIGGPALQAEGCQSLFAMSELSVIGIVEVAGRFFRLLSIRKQLKQFFLANRPDVFIGVDAPDFNLPLERFLRQHKIKTVHYVSPSVWAWREGRLKGIRQSVDLMLTLYPFEKNYYDRNAIPSFCTGHPLATEIPLTTDRDEARKQLGLASENKIIALLPGSRKGEVRRLTPVFLQCCVEILEHDSDVCLIAGLLDEHTGDEFRQINRHRSQPVDVHVYTNRTRTVIAAADIVLVASGTATLEVMLMKRPMVVAYKVNWLTGIIIKQLLKSKFVSLPNLLSGKQLVPELLQADCEPEKLAAALLDMLNNEDEMSKLIEQFSVLHRSLQQTGAAELADNISTSLPLKTA